MIFLKPLEFTCVKECFHQGSMRFLKITLFALLISCLVGISFAQNREEQQLKDLRDAARRIDDREREQRVQKIESDILTGPRKRISDDDINSAFINILLIGGAVIGFFFLVAAWSRRAGKKLTPEEEMDRRALNAAYDATYGSSRLHKENSINSSPVAYDSARSKPIPASTSPRTSDMQSVESGTSLAMKFLGKDAENHEIEAIVQSGHIYMAAFDKAGSALVDYGLTCIYEGANDKSSFSDIDFGASESEIDIELETLGKNVKFLCLYVKPTSDFYEGAPNITTMDYYISCNGEDGRSTRYTYRYSTESDESVHLEQLGYLKKVSQKSWRFVQSASSIKIDRPEGQGDFITHSSVLLKINQAFNEK
jgi:hypothetical protein